MPLIWAALPYLRDRKLHSICLPNPYNFAFNYHYFALVGCRASCSFSGRCPFHRASFAVNWQALEALVLALMLSPSISQVKAAVLQLRGMYL